MFEQLLNESLESEFPSQVTSKEFLTFLTAIVTSTSIEKIPQALERATALPSEDLSKVISQVQYNGDVMGLRNAVASKPEYSVGMIELAKRVLPETDIPGVVDSLSGGDASEETESYAIRQDGLCEKCGKGKMEDKDDNTYHGQQCNNCGAKALYCDHCDQYVSEDDPMIQDYGYCSTCSAAMSGEEEYNQDADYYSQGEDEGGH